MKLKIYKQQVKQRMNKKKKEIWQRYTKIAESSLCRFKITAEILLLLNTHI